MSLGYDFYTKDATSGLARGAVEPPSIGGGSTWTKKAFRSYLKTISARQEGEAIDYHVRLEGDDEGVYDTHEIIAGPDGMIYFTQQKHDRVGRLRTDGQVEYLIMPEGSGPHGIQFSSTKRLFVTFEFTDEIAEINPKDGSILNRFNIGFDNFSTDGVVGPHGLAIDKADQLWYTGKSSDTLGRLDPTSGEHTRFTLETRAEFAPYFEHGIDPKASGPIYIKFDHSGNAWFVNLLSNEIGKIDTNDAISLYKITGFETDNTRPINVFEGPDKNIWVTIEGEKLDPSTGSTAELGGIARFDPTSGTFLNSYQQYRSKGAGGTAGTDGRSVWFQYQEESLVELTINKDGRLFETTYDLPDIGQRVMHRVTKGPDRNIWFTSLMEDTVGVLTTDEQAIPTYSFFDKKEQRQYLSALPDEITYLQSKPSRYENQTGVFLSSTRNKQSTPTSRFKDKLTGNTYWSIDKDDIRSMKNSKRFDYEGKDFRVFADAYSMNDLVPVFEARDLSTGASTWSTDASSFEDRDLFSKSHIAWYAHPFEAT